MQQLIGDTPVQVEHVLQVPEAQTKEFLRKAATFIKSNHLQLRHTPYMLVLDTSGTTAPVLTIQQVIHNCGLGNCLFFVNEDLRLHRAEHGKADISSCSKLTREKNAFAILAADTYVYKWLRGIAIDEGDITGTHKDPLVGSKWHRPITDFDGLLADHRDNVITNEQGVQYWSDKQKRVLLKGQQGTEEIFHRALYWWLNHFVSNRLKVYGQPKGLGQYAMDIVVVTVAGSCLIEIKWMGKNESGTYCGQDHINEGLAQVKLYLDAEEDCICGHLVIYDGRSMDDHKSKSTYNDQLRHAKCTTPKILFLESDTPSKQAVKIAKQSAQ